MRTGAVYWREEESFKGAVAAQDGASLDPVNVTDETRGTEGAHT
jgi:hypothetical protein